MKLYTLSLSLFLGISPLLGSDYLTLEQQNEEMERAFNKNEKPIIINSTQVQNDLNELIQQILPDNLQQSLDSSNLSSVITLDDWQQKEKHAAETMFHRLNDALNFLLTNREIILSAISRNPEFIGLTCYTVGQDEQGKLYFEFPLLSASHPVANLAQGYLILKEYQYWIDILLLFKNTAFSQHTLSSYDHNAACAIKDLIKSQIGILKEKISAHPTNSVNLSQLIDQTDNHDLSFFVNADHNFHDLLKGHLKNIDDALPSGTVTQVNLRTAAPLKRKGDILDLGKNKRKLTLEKISPKIDLLYAYFSKNYPAILTGIRSIAIMDYVGTYFTQEEAKMAMPFPFYAAAYNESTRLTKGNWSYEKLFNGLKNNMVSVQKIRRELGLPKEIFKGLDFTEEMHKALKNYRLEGKTILMKQLENQEMETRIDIETQTIPSTSEKEEIPTESRNDQKTNQEYQQTCTLTIQESETFPNVVNETVEKSTEEENYIFDSTYFKVTHQYYQNQKNQQIIGNHPMQESSEYETNLYTYLMSSIFRPQQRPTWSDLISGLTGFGFKGKPNTSGNGSTWEFSITDKNELFFMDPDYKGAKFNVQKFKGNDPIHPRYLMYFQSGFSNVFGLTEEYLIKALGL